MAVLYANYVKKVIGIEMIPQSVEDARVNAQLNGQCT